LHRLASSFILGYHGCDQEVGEGLLAGDLHFRPSANSYDWLGPGIYFWESNPIRALEFAVESSRRAGSRVRRPFAVGSVIELGLCLDLTTSSGLALVRIAHQSLAEVTMEGGLQLPSNSKDELRRDLDCAVIQRLHAILEAEGQTPIDTVKGVFTEGKPLYPGAGFREKTHIQIAVRNPGCIKGVFRVPGEQLRS
jgi:hypothetical protein